MSDKDTIVAISSGAGVAGVAVIRISGPRAPDILGKLGAPDLVPRNARLVRLRHPASGDVLDRALSLFFPAPHSFTGEDVVELHVHGSRAVLASVIDAILTLGDGVRLANAGEFSRRAFINGKMDLAEAEGLAALIDSETEWQRRQALRLLEGELGRLVRTWRAPLVQAMACLDASLDFSDEADVPAEHLLGEIVPLLSPVLADIQKILASAASGERLRDGYCVAIIGAPNAGKSSLINAIAKRDVAIVSSEPGTTRDVLELRCDIEGIPVRFLDTAGIRPTTNPVEAEGIRRARMGAESSDLVLALHPVDSVAEQILPVHPCTWEVTTKIDLLSNGKKPGHAVSAVSGEGVDALLETIARHFKGLHGHEPALLSQARQHEALRTAVGHIESVLKHILAINGSSYPEELLAESLRLAVRALDRLIGRVDSEEVLDGIFGRFCIGK